MAERGGRVAIRAGRLLDVEAGAVRAGAVLLLEGDRIAAVLGAGEPVPDDVQQLDLSGHTVLPGLIDCHTHLVGEVTSASLPVDRSAAQEAFSGVRNARATVMAGFTTVRDVGTFRAFVDVALRDAIADGTVVGPRMAVAGAYVTVPGGGGEVTGLAPDVVLPPDLRFGVAASAAEVRTRARAILHGGADFIKVIATGAVLTLGTRPGVPELSEDEIRAAVEVAAAYCTHVAAHAHGTRGIVNAALAGARSVEHGSMLDDEAAALLADRGVYLVADIYNGDWIAAEGRRQGWPAETLAKNEATTRAQRDGFARAVRAGVRIAYGTDGGVYPHGWNARQLPYMVRHGMTPMAALRSATVVAAELLGWEDRVGSLAPGRFADVIAVPGDPLDDLGLLAEVPFVMQGGRVLKAPPEMRLPTGVI
jgi:imidazolonepropionase-like amidohydrolase